MAKFEKVKLLNYPIFFMTKENPEQALKDEAKEKKKKGKRTELPPQTIAHTITGYISGPRCPKHELVEVDPDISPFTDKVHAFCRRCLMPKREN